MKKDKIIFTHGFKYAGFRFGYLDSKLYRLPTKIHERNYSMRELPLINITEKIQGYRIIRDKKSIVQMKLMLKSVNFSVKSIHCEKCLK